MKIVQGYAHTNALICAIPWIASIFPWLPKPGVVEKPYRLVRERVMVGLPLGQTLTDIFSYLLREDRVSKRKYTQRELDIECVALVIRGMLFSSLAFFKRFYAAISCRLRYYLELVSVSDPNPLSEIL
jgi:hypothetical protein